MTPLPSFIQSCLDPLGKLTLRSMFGGTGIFIEGTMVAIMVRNVLFVKASTEFAKEYDEAGIQPYTYSKKNFPVRTKYYPVPDDKLEDHAKLAAHFAQIYAQATTEKQARENMPVHRIKDMPNLRFSTERMLKKVGIDSAAELKEAGAASAWYALKVHTSSNIDEKLLWALEGAIKGVHASQISDERKASLLKEISKKDEMRG